MGDFFAFRYGGAILKGPSADGTSGQMLQTDGSGNLSFATASGGSSDITGSTAGAPSPAADSDSDTGIFSPAPDVLAMSAGGVEGLRVTESGGEITSAVLANTTSTTDAQLAVENAGTGDAYIRLKAGGTSYAVGINNNFDDRLTIAASSSGDATLDSDRIVQILDSGSGARLIINAIFGRPLIIEGSDDSRLRPFVDNKNTSGDSQFSFASGGSTKWSNGYKASNGDYVIANSFDLGTDDYFRIDTTGNVSVDVSLVLPSYTDTTRPSPGTAGKVIFNTDDGQLNIDDGTNWTLPDGTTT